MESKITPLVVSLHYAKKVQRNCVLLPRTNEKWLSCTGIYSWNQSNYKKPINQNDQHLSYFNYKQFATKATFVYHFLNFFSLLSQFPAK